VGRRIHSLLTEAWHFVLLVAGAGVAVAGIAGLIGFAAGKRGGDLVVTSAIALGAVGIVSVLLATIVDPMALSADSRRYGYGVAVQAEQADLIHEMEAGLSPQRKAQFRKDDVLYGGGVLLIGLAVLAGFIGKWAGVPPTNPLGH
jgi:small ligand-binding sensory domain FIST